MSDADPWAGFEKDAGDPLEREWLVARAASGEPETFTDPLTTVMAFLYGARNLDEVETLELLGGIVTPESREAWGDFSSTARALEEWGDWGIGSQPKRAVGAADVAYAAIIPAVGDGFRSTAEQLIPTLATLTLVWRPEYGRWMVHQLGPMLPPDRVPRSSPGEAPL